MEKVPNIKREQLVAEIQEDVLSRELALLEKRKEDLLSQLQKTKEAIAAKEGKLALRKGEAGLIKEELGEAAVAEEHKKTIKKGMEKL